MIAICTIRLFQIDLSGRYFESGEGHACIDERYCFTLLFQMWSPSYGAGLLGSMRMRRKILGDRFYSTSGHTSYMKE